MNNLWCKCQCGKVSTSFMSHCWRNKNFLSVVLFSPSSSSFQGHRLFPKEYSSRGVRLRARCVLNASLCSFLFSELGRCRPCHPFTSHHFDAILVLFIYHDSGLLCKQAVSLTADICCWQAFKHFSFIMFKYRCNIATIFKDRKRAAMSTLGTL